MRARGEKVQKKGQGHALQKTCCVPRELLVGRSPPHFCPILSHSPALAPDSSSVPFFPNGHIPGKLRTYEQESVQVQVQEEDDDEDEELSAPL